MKRLFLIIGCVVGASVFSSCGGSKEEKTSDLTDDKSEKSVEENTTEETPEEVSTPQSDYSNKTAIALWDASIYKEAGNKGWLGSFKFGNQLKLTGDTASVKSGTKTRIYCKVILPDGKEGFVQDYLLAIDAELRVVTSEQTIFKNPDPTSLTTEKFEKGEMIAVYNSEEESNGFVKASNFEKKKNAVWIRKGKGLSSDETDIMIATQLRMVSKEKELDKKLTVLNMILEDENNMSSKLYAVAQELKNELTGDTVEEEAIPEEMMDEVEE